MQESSSAQCRCEETSPLLGEDSGPQKWHFKNFLQRITTRYSPVKYRILKNVICLSASQFFLRLTTFTLGSLQSTVNGEEGVGVVSLAVHYGVGMVCLLLFSDILSKSMTSFKKLLALMIALQLPYYASNFYPTWATMIPTAALAGLIVGLIPITYALYINEMSVLYHSEQDSQSLESVTSKFFGIFTFFNLNSSIWGNLITYVVLMPSTAPQFNQTNVSCGIDFVNGSQSDNGNLDPPSDEARYILVGTCMLSTVISIVGLIAFVDDVDLKKNHEEGGRSRSLLMSLSAVARHACVPDQALLVPLSIYMGFLYAFFSADFTQAYVACSWGIYHIGFVIMCYATCGAITGCFVGKLVNCTSQVFAFIVAACLNILVFILLYIWKPSPDHVEAYFIISGIWGVTDGLWFSLVLALYGLLFPENRGVAFSFLYICLFLGFALSYSTSNYLSTWMKLVVNFSLLLIGMAGYLIGQIKIRVEKIENQKKKVDPTS